MSQKERDENSMMPTDCLICKDRNKIYYRERRRKLIQRILIILGLLLLLILFIPWEKLIS